MDEKAHLFPLGNLFGAWLFRSIAHPFLVLHVAAPCGQFAVFPRRSRKQRRHLNLGFAGAASPSFVDALEAKMFVSGTRMLGALVDAFCRVASFGGLAFGRLGLIGDAAFSGLEVTGTAAFGGDDL